MQRMRDARGEVAVLSDVLDDAKEKRLGDLDLLFVAFM